MRLKALPSLQPVYRNLDWRQSGSVNVRVDSGQHLSETFHYHPQVELILLRNCHGNVLIGTKVCPIEKDAIFLIGKNTPHGFRYRPTISKNKEQLPHAIVVQFDEHFLGRDFFSIPESFVIKRILSLAKNGLAVTESKSLHVADVMERMLDESGFKKVLLLLEILNTMQEQVDDMTKLETEINASPNHLNHEDIRLQEVWEYTARHFERSIRIEEVAAQVNLTKESFCRFFKAKTQMTYMEYLFAYRIEKAKTMIIENRLSVKEIGYACGFFSLSSFYYQFKKIMNCSPLEFQHKLLGQLQN